ncbi:hypothetical protein ABBQ32_007072 [Trebouxia sp. C0010 RCD-2024]
MASKLFAAGKNYHKNVGAWLVRGSSSFAWDLPGPGTTGSSTPTGCPEELWAEFQNLRKSQTSGRAPWWSQWEFVLYKPGDLRNGVRCENGAIFFRHKECGGEYSTKNFSQTATKHNCNKARNIAPNSSGNDEKHLDKKPKTSSVDKFFWTGAQTKKLKGMFAQILYENSSSVPLSIVESESCDAFLKVWLASKPISQSAPHYA